jgi:hypothetical protein
LPQLAQLQQAIDTFLNQHKDVTYCLAGNRIYYLGAEGLLLSCKCDKWINDIDVQPYDRVDKIICLSGKERNIIVENTGYNSLARFTNQMKFLESIVGNIKNIIQNAQQLAAILEFFVSSVEFQEKIINFLGKNWLITTIVSGNELVSVLRVLRSKNRTILLEIIKDQLSDMINDGGVLIKILLAFKYEDQIKILKIVNSKISNMIGNTGQLVAILKIVQSLAKNPLGIIDLIGANKLKQIITSMHELTQVLRVLGAENQAIILNIIKQQIVSMIKTNDELEQMFYLVRTQEHSENLDRIKKELRDTIRSNQEIRETFEAKTIDNINKGWIIAIIKNANKLILALSMLEALDNKIKIIAILNRQLRDIICNVSELVAVLEALRASAETQKNIINFIGVERIKTLIINIDQLDQALHVLEDEDLRKDFVQTIYAQNKNIITNFVDFKRIFELIPHDACYAILFTDNDFIQLGMSLINNLDDVIAVLGCSADQDTCLKYARFIGWLRISKFINSLEDLRRLMPFNQVFAEIIQMKCISGIENLIKRPQDLELVCFLYVSAKQETDLQCDLQKIVSFIQGILSKKQPEIEIKDNIVAFIIKAMGIVGSLKLIKTVENLQLLKNSVDSSTFKVIVSTMGIKNIQKNLAKTEADFALLEVLLQDLMLNDLSETTDVTKNFFTK